VDSESTPETPKSTADIAYRASEAAADPPLAKNRNHLRRSLIVGLIGAVVIGCLQWFAPSFDHQIANMISLVVGVVTALLVIYQLQRWAGKHGHRLGFAAVLILGIAGLLVMFQFEGFSGEMLPQFKSRFGSPPPELRSLSDTTASAGSTESDGGVIEAESASPQVVTEVDSTGFLGSQRTGVIASRSFDVSAIESEVEILWNQGIGEGWSSFAVSADRGVTLEQRDELECLTCYRLGDGELLWIKSHEARHQHPLGGVGPRSTPTISGDRVYAQGATGRVWCLDLQTGETIWSVDLLDLAGWDQVTSELAITWGRATSPLIVDGLCIVPYGGPEENQETGRSLIAFDADTGDVRWTAGEDQISYGSPGLLTLGGKRQVVSVNEKTITGHNIADGKLLWEFEWPGQSNGGANCAMVVPAGKDRFLIGKGYGGGSSLVQVSVKDDGSFAAEAVWNSTRLLKTKFTHACVDGDVAYAISNGSLEAVAIEAAQQQWQQPRRSRFGQGQILLVEDTIVAQSESGEVVFVAADPAEYRELAQLPAMDSKTWNIPTVAGRYLLVRNDRQAICYLLPERSEID
jgi:outer membrane protein assembly factor BamB